MQTKQKFRLVAAILILMLSPLISAQNKAEFVVAIDIGHTPKEPGAISSRGISEYSYNKNMANLLLDDLKSLGFISSFVINPHGKEISLRERTKKAKEKSSKLFISIHHDSVNEKYLKRWKYKGKYYNYSDKFSGHSIFISSKNKENLVVARIIGQNLLESDFIPTLHHAEKIKGENRKLIDEEKGIYEFNELVVLKTSEVPALLFECGVILNRLNEKMLSNKAYQKEISLILANSINEYFAKRHRPYD